MPKIKISRIVSDIENFQDLFDLEFKVLTKNKNSSNSFDGSHSLVVEVFGALFVLVAIAYYQLQSQQSKLASKKIATIESISKIVTSDFLEVDPSQYEITIAKDLLTKFKRLEISKGEFEKFNFVIFDDPSQAHLAAFKIWNLSEMPRQNILLKFTIDGVHIRCGIVKNNEGFEIIDIVKKANRNK